MVVILSSFGLGREDASAEYRVNTGCGWFDDPINDPIPAANGIIVVLSEGETNTDSEIDDVVMGDEDGNMDIGNLAFG
jgi:hypothetical protein